MKKEVQKQPEDQVCDHEQKQPEDQVCDHEWVECMDEDGNLLEPPADVCVQCGLERY